MIAAREARTPFGADADEDPSTAERGDQVLLLHDVPWSRYLALRRLLDDVPGLRMTYLEGALELMSPSPLHEEDKKLLARLIELYALERDLDLYGFGSTTYRKRARERGLEPDECYCIGKGRGKRRVPDLAIEVAVSRSGIDKLEVYRGLGVAEVWFWGKGRLVVHRLGAAGYTAHERSALLPDLDLNELVSFLKMKDQSAAVRAYRDRLRQGG